MAAEVAPRSDDVLSELLIAQLLEEDMQSLASAKAAEKLQLDTVIAQSAQAKQRIPKVSKPVPKTDEDLALELLAADSRLTSDAAYAQMLQQTTDVNIVAGRHSAMQLAAAERKALLDAEFARRLQAADERGLDITDVRMMDAEQVLGADTINDIMASDPNNKGKAKANPPDRAVVKHEAPQEAQLIPVKRGATPSYPPQSSGKGKGPDIKRIKLEPSEDVHPTCGICMEAFQATFNPIAASRSANSSSRLPFGLHLPCPKSHGSGATNTEAAVFPICCPECSIVEWPEGIQDEITERLLEKEAMTLWHHRKLLDSIPRYYCPNPRCSALVQLPPNQEEVQAMCPSCSKLVCIPCKVTWHENMTCEEYQALPLDERSAEDQMLLQLAKAKNWRRCPTCSVIVELTVGCNHITCRCKTHFCFKCGSLWGIQARRCTRDPPCELWDDEMLLEERERERQAHQEPAPAFAAPRPIEPVPPYLPVLYQALAAANRDRRVLDWMTDPDVICGRHWFTHAMLQDLTCGYCNVKLNSVADLQYHLAHTRHHPVYACCGRFFKRDVDFERHTHSNPRRFGSHIHQLQTH
ncbi:hypothetical protein NEOLEDRAFT_1161274 [Neolentinus lepideus HHB14362 ss-1]|uniref:RBR-type E3 ubiquitin transferase n=1 Tax=Neolentinus lepideus HHB14362 ss-1 TaxID=1314782 RepID=A0A165UFQ1_9AGAM|nr:hypothetical protein NEOLEDRAFT_1161274 [Neolentinus lepideus HHB14362 ss-1]